MQLNERATLIYHRIIFAMMIVFATGATISISLQEIGAAIAMVLFLAGLFLGTVKLGKTELTIPILMYICGYIITILLVSPDKNGGMKDFLHYFWKIPLFYIFISFLDLEHYQKVLDALLAVAIFAAIYGIIQSFTGIDIWHGTKLNTGAENGFYFASGFTGLHLTYGGLMSMICLVFLSRLLSGTEKNRIWFLLPGTLLCAAATLFSFSRSAWVGLAAGVLFFFVANIKKTWIWLIAFIILCTGITILIPPINQKVHSIISIHELRHSHRSEIWGTAINIIKKHPVFGIGSGNFIKQYVANQPPGTRWEAMGQAHNDVLNSWLDGGILATAGYLSIFILLVILGLRAWIRDKLKGSLALGLTAAVVAMFFQGLSQCYITTAQNAWLFWFCAAGIVITSQKGLV